MARVDTPNVRVSGTHAVRAASSCEHCPSPPAIASPSAFAVGHGRVASMQTEQVPRKCCPWQSRQQAASRTKIGKATSRARAATRTTVGRAGCTYGRGSCNGPAMMGYIGPATMGMGNYDGQGQDLSCVPMVWPDACRVCCCFHRLRSLSTHQSPYLKNKQFCHPGACCCCRLLWSITHAAFVPLQQSSRGERCLMVLIAFDCLVASGA